MDMDLKREQPHFFLRPVYLKLGELFRVGVVFCFGLLSVGIILSVDCDPAHYSVFCSRVGQVTNGQLVTSTGLPQKWNEVKKAPFRPGLLLVFAIGVLILLPVLRMWAALVYFLSERDYLYAGMTAIVVTGITASLFVLALR